jgi:hypothetical protein
MDISVRSVHFAVRCRLKLGANHLGTTLGTMRFGSMTSEPKTVSGAWKITSLY